jgi:hypothetical protein
MSVRPTLPGRSVAPTTATVFGANIESMIGRRGGRMLCAGSGRE